MTDEVLEEQLRATQDMAFDLTERLRVTSERLAEAERWIDAKCTIAGCWKSKFEAANARIVELETELSEANEALGVYGIADMARWREALERISNGVVLGKMTGRELIADVEELRRVARAALGRSSDA